MVDMSMFMQITQPQNDAAQAECLSPERAVSPGSVPSLLGSPGLEPAAPGQPDDEVPEGGGMPSTLSYAEYVRDVKTGPDSREQEDFVREKGVADPAPGSDIWLRVAQTDPDALVQQVYSDSHLTGAQEKAASTPSAAAAGPASIFTKEQVEGQVEDHGSAGSLAAYMSTLQGVPGFDAELCQMWQQQTLMPQNLEQLLQQQQQLAHQQHRFDMMDQFPGMWPDQLYPHYGDMMQFQGLPYPALQQHQGPYAAPKDPRRPQPPCPPQGNPVSTAASAAAGTSVHEAAQVSTFSKPAGGRALSSGPGQGLVRPAGHAAAEKKSKPRGRKQKKPHPSQRDAPFTGYWNAPRFQECLIEPVKRPE
eukprot:TRINITY_DN16294_c0_g1_i1.p1 TRINITY_DN16294_c0_g1~~TRINITY_DN16294_c0_g1_i1.p1  ORF type:complete len:362 (+),score=75.79 TRINITY_DN16294_c0_g1_i1:101-1186(+)